MSSTLLSFILLCAVFIHSATAQGDIAIADHTEHLDAPITGHNSMSIGGTNIEYNIQDGMYITQGDIVLGIAGRRRLVSMMLPNLVTLWTDGYVPYIIDDGFPSDYSATHIIQNAIAHWEHHTKLRFGVRDNEDFYVRFKPGSGCSSWVGKVLGGQTITLDDWCDVGATIHEIGHAIGFWHTQSRTDRDEYVTINWDNIEEKKKFNFWMMPFGMDCGHYDYGSIMHYSSKAFALNDDYDTITALQKNTTIGSRTGLSDNDIQCAAHLYGCSLDAHCPISMCGCADGQCVERCEDGHCKQKDYAGFYYCPSVCKAGIDCPAGTCGDKKAEYDLCECSGQCSGDMTCCDGQCRVLQNDWANVPYCPHECKAGALCPSGSCSDIDRSNGETCDCNEQCSGNMKCCDGECRALEQDWANVPYCPHECKAGALCPSGSCSDISRSNGDLCECDEQCSGNMKCCNGECRWKQKDWAGFWYCPHECKIGALCPSGSCGDNKSEYQSCQCSEQCSGDMTCCNGECRWKQKDWAGVYYCPHQCNGGCGWGGSCPSGRSTGSSCSCRAQCNSGCCEKGKCVAKKRDWARVKYCPAECRGGIFKGPGTC